MLSANLLFTIPSEWHEIQWFFTLSVLKSLQIHKLRQKAGNSYKKQEVYRKQAAVQVRLGAKSSCIVDTHPSPQDKKAFLWKYVGGQFKGGMLCRWGGREWVNSISSFGSFFFKHMKRERAPNAEHHSPTWWIYLLCISSASECLLGEKADIQKDRTPLWGCCK